MVPHCSNRTDILHAEDVLQVPTQQIVGDRISVRPQPGDVVQAARIHAPPTLSSSLIRGNPRRSKASTRILSPSLVSGAAMRSTTAGRRGLTRTTFSSGSAAKLASTARIGIDRPQLMIR